MRNKFRKTQNGVVLDFSGTVAANDNAWLYDWFEAEYICPKDVRDAIEMAAGAPITLRMNSPGGDLYAGSEMYSDLMAYPGTVTVEIMSVSASAASAVAMVSAKEGNRCRISPMGVMIIHNVQGGVNGDYRDMADMSEKLLQANKTIIAAYQKKTGLPENEIQEMLDKETWLTAQEAVDKGFADEVMFKEAPGEETSALVAHAKTLVNAIPHINSAAVKKLMERQKGKADQSEELQAAAALLELEQNRF